MENLINPQLNNIQISGIRRFFNMVSGKENMISLSIGQPDFPTPENVKQAGIEAIQTNQTTYTHNAGMLPLRKAISSFVNDAYGLTYDPESEIIVSVGASQAIDVTFRTILVPGDEVILPGPVYPGYEPLIRLAGATPIHVDTRDSGFKLTKDKLEQAITENTKCIVLPYPSNPTGATLSEEELAELAAFLKDRNIFVLSDEIYSELVYEDNHRSIANYEGMKEKTIVINGLSKSHSMTGWRLGYSLAPSWLRQHMLKVHQYNVSCATSITQHAALEALQNGRQDAVEMKEQYHQRRDFVYNRLLKLGIEVEKPGGAFYLFPKLSIAGHSSFDLGLDLVEKVGLALVPGDAFSLYGEGYMRISYAYSMDVLEEGMDRLQTYLEEHVTE
ncbi:aminotransferase A [Pontibacillus halophilus JSM 076056 = DSM 19796]|uniref:Aminotransferase n=1 Tax=Pontibacillus halophilus JSM 076056 = DSM 19796 TaxID=1385510 RepID=A0A0A5GHW7_9BACI|nr:aminotransferase A [Pontibacillus halophilus]KGX91584.1 aminotransferase A [Pontibacillus halophilus JSM 076056 = DSM 19796]